MFILHAHLAFVTTYRHGVLSARHPVRMEQIMRDVGGADSSTEPAGLNGDATTFTCW